MKRVKYFICILLMMVGFLFNGELFVFYLDNFQESYYRSSFAFVDLPKGITDTEIARDFLEAGKKHNVDFFMVDGKIKSAYEKEITIYGTEDALKYLQRQGISESEYASFSVGKVNVHYEAFEKIKHITKYEYCYFLGSQARLEDLRAFKAELIDRYGGGFPKLYGSDNETWMNLFSVWAIIFSFILIITIYEVIYQKKEIMVRLILGEDLKTIFLKNILADTSVFILIFLTILTLLSNVSTVSFKLLPLSLFFILFLVVNIAIHVTILLVDFKKDIAGASRVNTLLTATYALKTITAVLAILLLSSNFVIIKQGYDFYRQQDFFEKHKNYSYYRLNYKLNNHLGKTTNDENMVNQIFYKQFQDQSLQYVDLTENFDRTYPVLLINRNSMKEISQEWPTLEEAQKKAVGEKVFMLLPSNVSLDSKKYDHAERLFNYLFEGQAADNVEIIEYKGDIDLVGIHNQVQFKSNMRHNPILLFNNTVQRIDEKSAEDMMNYAYDTMYIISKKDFQGFTHEFQLEDQIVVKSNVLDVYEYNWNILSRSLKVVFILTSLLILLEMALIVFIVLLEYRFNSVEMALKKVYGYTLFERNRRIIKITLFSSLFSIAGAFIISYVYGIQEGLNLIWGGILLLVLELGYIVKKANSIEKVKISGILKGERI